MGFDLCGIKPRNADGGYFHNNIWWWRPLWSYVCNTCRDILTEEDCHSGHCNDFHEISADKAMRIAERLDTLLSKGDVTTEEATYKQYVRSLPDEGCEICHGTGVRKDQYVNGQCNACGGQGKVRPFITWYPFTEENVRGFVSFARDSGGFVIG